MSLDALDHLITGQAPTATGPVPVEAPLNTPSAVVPAPTQQETAAPAKTAAASAEEMPDWAVRLEAKLDHAIEHLGSISGDVRAAKEGLELAQQQLAPMMGGLSGMVKSMFGGGGAPGVIPATAGE